MSLGIMAKTSAIQTNIVFLFLSRLEVFFLKPHPATEILQHDKLPLQRSTGLYITAKLEKLFQISLIGAQVFFGDFNDAESKHL